MQKNNQQFGNKMTQQQYMMAQRQAYMQRMRQQYLYQQRMAQQNNIKQTMQSPRQVANQMNNKINPMQNAGIGFNNQPINNSPEYNFYQINQNMQNANQQNFANKSQVKIQWKFDEGARPSVPQQAPLQSINQNPQQVQSDVQSVPQPQFQAPVQGVQQTQEEQNETFSQAPELEEIEKEEELLKGLQIEHNGKIIDMEHMTIEELENFREQLIKEREEVLAKMRVMMTKDPSLNPIRLEDFPYYETVKKFQKGV